MSILGANILTLADWAKRLDPDGKIAAIVEMLSQTNEILLDMPYKAGNLPTGERTTVRTGLPSVFWRLLNQGVQVSKSLTAQITEGTGLLEAWSEVDEELVNLNENPGQFRLSESGAFIEAMNQEHAGTVIYGNSGTAPEEFNGLAPRYSSLSAGNAQNIISGSGSGSDNTSIWLIVWGPQTVHGIFPKASQAGLEHIDHGKQVTETVGGVAGSRMSVFRDQWKWKCGLVLRDWRYAVRICNIDVSNLTGESSAANLIKLMIKAVHRIPAMGMGKPVFYMNRTVAQMLDIQRLNLMGGITTSTNYGGSIQYNDVDGKWVPNFRGIPIRMVDQILNTEAAVS